MFISENVFLVSYSHCYQEFISRERIKVKRLAIVPLSIQTIYLSIYLSIYQRAAAGCWGQFCGKAKTDPAFCTQVLTQFMNRPRVFPFPLLLVISFSTPEFYTAFILFRQMHFTFLTAGVDVSFHKGILKRVKDSQEYKHTNRGFEFWQHIFINKINIDLIFQIFLYKYI